MSSPIDLFRKGIQTGQWAPVCEAFKMMTGQELAPPAPATASEKAQDALLQVHAYLTGTLYNVPGPSLPKVEQVAVVDDTTDEEEVLSDEPVQRQRPRRIQPRRSQDDFDNPDEVRHSARPQQQTASVGNRQARNEPWRPPTGPNRFVDDPRTFPKEAAESEKLSQQITVKEYRDPIQYVAVTCCKCKRDFDVEPMLAPKNVDPRGTHIPEFTCDECFGPAARACRGAD